jgi:hypothetical protein
MHSVPGDTRQARINEAKARLKARTDLAPSTKRQILENMERGLLCACNKVRIPYFDAEGEPHGVLCEDNTIHGYDDCCKVE